MKLKSNIITVIEILLIIILFNGVILEHWDKLPIVGDYFALMIIMEFTFDLYNKFKDKI
jgi:hypothetical protein